MAYNNNVTNSAGQLSAITAPFVFAATGTVTTIGTLPASAQIVDINIDITTAFNAATTNTVTVGKTGTAAAYVTSTSVGSTGRASIASSGVYSAWATVGTTDVDYATITYTQTGTAATAGAGVVTIVYKAFA